MTNFDFSTEKKPDINEIISKIKEVSTLPQVLKKILDVTADPSSGASDLQDILKSDPALTIKILKVANSAYYGLSQKVTNVKKAIIFLGFKTVKNLSVAVSVSDMFSSDEIILGYSRSELWKHSVSVAICAKSITQRMGLVEMEDIFTAGIMHDVGIIIEDQYINEYFKMVLTDKDLASNGIIETERKIFGFDHSALGEKVVRLWKIPEEIAILISYHHKPSVAPEKYRQSVAIIYLADIICSVKKIGTVLNRKINKRDLDAAMTVLNFTKEDVNVIIEDLNIEIERAKDLFVI
jgi:putative nucleotidyltransferase with HDIG domain